MFGKILLLSMVGFLNYHMAFACDACGCSSTGSGIGMMTSFYNNFVRLNYQVAPFRAAPRHGHSSRDYFHKTELSFRYYLTDRFKILLFQPYKVNVRNDKDEIHAVYGVSDSRIAGSYSVFRDKNLAKNVFIFLELGLGIKLPTGHYDPTLHNKELPDNFNVGSGNWAFLFIPNLVLKYKKTGLMLGSRYQHNLPSRSGYLFGHQLSSNVQLYYEKSFSNRIKAIPNAGLALEWTAFDRYANDIFVTGTGGRGAFLQAGINLINNKFLIGASIFSPISQSYSMDEVIAEKRISCQLAYLF